MIIHLVDLGQSQPKQHNIPNFYPHPLLPMHHISIYSLNNCTHTHHSSPYMTRRPCASSSKFDSACVYCNSLFLFKTCLAWDLISTTFASLSFDISLYHIKVQGGATVAWKPFLLLEHYEYAPLYLSHCCFFTVLCGPMFI